MGGAERTYKEHQASSVRCKIGIECCETRKAETKGNKESRYRECSCWMVVTFLARYRGPPIGKEWFTWIGRYNKRSRRE